MEDYHQDETKVENWDGLKIEVIKPSSENVDKRSIGYWTGTIWINNGIEAKRIKGDIPEGWVKGKIPVTPEGSVAKATNAGKIVITNGTNERRIYPGDLIPEGWWHGKVDKRDQAARYKAGQAAAMANSGTILINNGIVAKRIKGDVLIPEGWIKGKIPNPNKNTVANYIWYRHKVTRKGLRLPQGQTPSEEYELGHPRGI